MTLQASGAIDMNQINTEFGYGTDLNSYRGKTWYTDAGGSGTFSTGAISMSDFYGKRKTSPSFNATISTNQNKLNLRSWAISNGYSGSGAAQITIASGVYIYSDDINTAALTIDGSWGGLTLINNGYIMGMGGHGGGSYYSGSTYTTPYEQTAGGPAINMGVSCTIQNNSYIGGGGGGGGPAMNGSYLGGGGAGGGQGGSFNNNGTWTYGGAGGAPGSAGSNGSAGQVSGGGGGRIMPGNNTVNTATVTAGSTTATATSTGGGAGNNGSGYATPSSQTASATVTQSFDGVGGQAGGTGPVFAGLGNSTSSYTFYTYAPGGGGGWGASGGSSVYYTTAALQTSYAGSAGGKCVNLNGYSVTWSATGTRYGGIS